MSPSAFVPGLPSKRVAKLYGPLNAPLPAVKVPFPSLSFPSHTADACLVGIRNPPVPGGRRSNLAGRRAGRYASGGAASRVSPEGGVDDGHEEEESHAPGAQTGPAQARSTPAA